MTPNQLTLLTILGTSSIKQSVAFGTELRQIFLQDDPVNPISSSELEMLYIKYPYGVNIQTAAGTEINFLGFWKTNLTTGQVQKIKRSLFIEHIIRCNCADQAPSVPAHWENLDPREPFQTFTVDRETKEFKEVEKYAREVGLLQEPLKYIHRIQNIDLWELYSRKKTQLMRIKGQTDIEERMLFHGTGKENVPSICLYNFDCRISDSRRSGNLYGKGTYFSIHASYADMYSRGPSQGHTNETRIMFLARVIVGKYTTGQRNLCKPDDGQIKNLHDSCVDDILYPRIFVIFNSNQIYPEYVLEYGG